MFFVSQRAPLLHELIENGLHFCKTLRKVCDIPIIHACGFGERAIAQYALSNPQQWLQSMPQSRIVCSGEERSNAIAALVSHGTPFLRLVPGKPATQRPMTTMSALNPSMAMEASVVRPTMRTLTSESNAGKRALPALIQTTRRLSRMVTVRSSIRSSPAPEAMSSCRVLIASLAI